MVDFWLGWFNLAVGVFGLAVGIGIGFDSLTTVCVPLNFVFAVIALVPLSYRGASS